MEERILLVDGKDRIDEIRKRHKKTVAEFQKEVNDITRGYVYAPRTWKTQEGLKTGYYWYRYVYKAREDGSRYRTQKYIGKEKPDFNLPDPPKNPLDGTPHEVVGNNILMDSKRYHNNKRLFKGLKAFKVK